MGNRLQELLAKQEALTALIAEVEAVEKANKVVEEIAGDLAKALVASAKKRNVDIATLHEKQLSITVEDGNVSFAIVEKKASNGRKSSNGNGKGKAYEYKLKDGRTFTRLVDAIEAMTGKPCELKHDGKIFEDGKPKLRYSRLTDDLKTAIEQVEASQPATEATGDGQTDGQPEAETETDGQPEAETETDGQPEAETETAKA